MRKRFHIIISYACLLAMVAVQVAALTCSCEMRLPGGCVELAVTGRQDEMTRSHRERFLVASGVADHSGPDAPTIYSQKCACLDLTQDATRCTENDSSSIIRLLSVAFAAHSPVLPPQPVLGVDLPLDEDSRYIAVHLVTSRLRC